MRECNSEPIMNNILSHMGASDGQSRMCDQLHAIALAYDPAGEHKLDQKNQASMNPKFQTFRSLFMMANVQREVCCGLKRWG